MISIQVTTLLILTLLPLIAWTRSAGSAFRYANMDHSCEKTITLNGDKLPGVFFSLTSDTYAPNLNCTLTIRAATQNQRIIMVIDKMDLVCPGDRILVYDGKVDAALILNRNQSQQCGTSKYYLRTTKSNTAIIHFTSDGDGKVGTGFVVNAAINFPVATCSRSDNLYRCKNNFCISNSFNCDDRNWCGDNTQLYVCR